MCPVNCRQWAFRYLFGLELHAICTIKISLFAVFIIPFPCALGYRTLQYVALHFVHALPSDVSLTNPTSFPFHLTI